MELEEWSGVEQGWSGVERSRGIWAGGGGGVEWSGEEEGYIDWCSWSDCGNWSPGHMACWSLGLEHHTGMLLFITTNIIRNIKCFYHLVV